MRGTAKRNVVEIVYYYNCNNLSRKVQTLCKAATIIFHNNIFVLTFSSFIDFFMRIKFLKKMFAEKNE